MIYFLINGHQASLAQNCFREEIGKLIVAFKTEWMPEIQTANTSLKLHLNVSKFDKTETKALPHSSKLIDGDRIKKSH